MEAQFVLIGIGRCTRGTRRVLTDGDQVVIGRHSGCSIAIRVQPDCLDVDLVSRQHAVLESDSGGWTVCDAGSENGTAVLAGGLQPSIRLDAGVAHRLLPDDVIELAGSTDFSFRFTTYAP